MADEVESEFALVYASEAENAERLELPTNLEDASLNVQTLTRAFPGAHGLKYKNPNTGAYRALSTDTTGTFFCKPADGWKDKLFIVIFSHQPQVDAFTTPHIEISNIERMKQYIYTVDGVVACATAIGTNILASCYHCIKHCVLAGPGADELVCHREAVIDLTHGATNRKIKAKIRIYSIEKDAVLLETSDELMVDGEIAFHDAWLGQPYYLLGTSISDDGNNIQLISGRISSVLQLSFKTSYAHSLHGHGSARPGASGGPVFARHLTDGKLTLLGIVMAGQVITHNTTLLTFVSSNYVKIISIITLAEMFHQQNVFKF